MKDPARGGKGVPDEAGTTADTEKGEVKPKTRHSVLEEGIKVEKEVQTADTPAKPKDVDTHPAPPIGEKPTPS